MIFVIDKNEESFFKRKQNLRGLYKRYKVGLVTEEDLTDEQRALLMKYYGL